jgi:hypothetical protein
MRRVLFWLAIGMLGTAAPAAADTLRLSNCLSGKTATIFNSLCAWPPTVTTLPACGTLVFNCDGGCKVRFGSGELANDCGAAVPAHRGEQTVIKPESDPDIAETSWVRALDDEPGYAGTPSNWQTECSCRPDRMQW